MDMPVQMDLRFLATTKGPAISPVEVSLLIETLRRADGWLTADALAELTGLNDRKIRRIASATMPQVVSFPGSEGYRLFQHCTVEEINHCIEAFESQGKDMLKRAVLYRQAYHRRFRGQPT